MTPHTKITTLDQLGERSRAAARAGQRVVLAHGVFDLLHLGHLRHLTAARAEGELLLVTITADHLVNKGPGRPVFTAEHRAEMLAALECVDGVAVNHTPTAEHPIAVIRPAIYVKGQEYATAAADLTGKISAEQLAVERYGGRVVFTDDLTFSSSNLINRHLGVLEPGLQGMLDTLDRERTLAGILELAEQVSHLRVLLVGDAIIDEYQYADPLGKSPKENMIATLFKGRELFAGGVFAAANHVANFCAQVEVITILGAAESHEELIRASLKPNVTLTPLFRHAAPTTRKCRFIETSYLRKMFEVYFMDDSPPPAPLASQLADLVTERAPEFDLVIVTDFGHGLISRGLVAELERSSRFLAVNTQSNSANLGYNLITKYPRADYVCIDAPEARLAMADKFLPMEELISQVLPQRIACPRVVVTHGSHGCYLFHAGVGMQRIPAFTKTVVDTVGAGDAFFVVTAPFVAAGAPMEWIGLIGNAAGALKVGIVGHRSSVEKVALLKFLTALLK